MSYFNTLCQAMTILAEQPNSIFLGQAVTYEGTAMYNTLKHIDINKRLELPVFEDTQLGMATGLSLIGFLPVCIYPRINFLLLAMNQLVLHLDKIPIYGNGFKPKVIIRTAIATPEPLDPGPQHLGDFIIPLELMLTTIKVVDLKSTYYIKSEYKNAVKREDSTLLVEHLSMYP